jgi:hypothetical protein
MMMRLLMIQLTVRDCSVALCCASYHVTCAGIHNRQSSWGYSMHNSHSLICDSYKKVRFYVAQEWERCDATTVQSPNLSLQKSHYAYWSYSVNFLSTIYIMTQTQQTIICCSHFLCERHTAWVKVQLAQSWRLEGHPMCDCWQGCTYPCRRSWRAKWSVQDHCLEVWHWNVFLRWKGFLHGL